MGSKGWEESVALTVAQMPNHTHTVNATNSYGDVEEPTGAIPARDRREDQWSTNPSGTTLVQMKSSMVANAGSGVAHENMPPFLVVNFCIALQGIFPPRN